MIRSSQQRATHNIVRPGGLAGQATCRGDTLDWLASTLTDGTDRLDATRRRTPTLTMTMSTMNWHASAIVMPLDGRCSPGRAAVTARERPDGDNIIESPDIVDSPDVIAATIATGWLGVSIRCVAWSPIPRCAAAITNATHTIRNAAKRDGRNMRLAS